MVIGICEIPTMALVNFTIPKADTIHTKSGLILHYLSDFQPADRIITFTVTIPMTADMCYLIPKSTKNKIPHCQSDSLTMKNMKKKLLQAKHKQQQLEELQHQFTIHRQCKLYQEEHRLM